MDGSVLYHFKFTANNKISIHCFLLLWKWYLLQWQVCNILSCY